MGRLVHSEAVSWRRGSKWVLSAGPRGWPPLGPAARRLGGESRPLGRGSALPCPAGGLLTPGSRAPFPMGTDPPHRFQWPRSLPLMSRASSYVQMWPCLLPLDCGRIMMFLNICHSDGILFANQMSSSWHLLNIRVCGHGSYALISCGLIWAIYTLTILTPHRSRPRVFHYFIFLQRKPNIFCGQAYGPSPS